MPEFINEKPVLHRREFETKIPIDPEDINIFRRLQIKLDNINNSINLASKAIGNASKDTREAYFTAAFKHQDEIQDQLTDWWASMKTKYDVSDFVRTDFDKSCFYELVDDNSVPSSSNDYILKED